jgi:hypothetical protein
MIPAGPDTRDPEPAVEAVFPVAHLTAHWEACTCVRWRSRRLPWCRGRSMRTSRWMPG